MTTTMIGIALIALILFAWRRTFARLLRRAGWMSEPRPMKPCPRCGTKSDMFVWSSEERNPDGSLFYICHGCADNELDRASRLTAGTEGAH